MSRPGHKRLGDSLVDSGAITLEQLDDALVVQRRTGERLGRALVKLGYTTDATIAAVIERQFGVPRISLSEYVVASDMIALVPEAMARRYKVLPVEITGNK
ncbi:MAG TPA: type II secretion system protein GspE, partial [Bacillota bacterium]|nr:type II secretion system protein GspE [Bacillota bacterium]